MNEFYIRSLSHPTLGFRAL